VPQTPHRHATAGRPGLFYGEGASCPNPLGADDQRWVDGLADRGVDHERTCRELHAILLRAAKVEVAQRCNAHHLSGADLDDIACQAASDALLLIIRKAGEFRGESRFTTWATRFVGFEVRAKLRQHAARHRTIGLVPEHDARLVEANADPSVQAEARELAEAIRAVVNGRFSARQRTVFVALLMPDVTPEHVGLQLGLNANAIYQIAFRARRCLRAQLCAEGLLN